jgi:hypothetical protein
MLPVKAKHNIEMTLTSIIKLVACIVQVLLLNLSREPGYPERDFPVFLISMITPETGHARLLSNTSISVNQQPPYYSTP